MLGMILSVVAAILLGTSATVQKYSMKDIRKFSVRKLLSNRFWMSSILIGASGTLVYLFAMRYSPLHVVQPIIAVSMLIPVIAGNMIFGEKIGSKWLYIVIIFIGVWLLSF
jgi:drug/metabolite transporter (DMT)-like permease